MPPENDFHLHFVKGNHSFDIDFIQQDQTRPESFLIGGKNYTLLGATDLEVDWIKEKLQEITDRNKSAKELVINTFNATDITDLIINDKVHSIGITQLNATVEGEKTTAVIGFVA